jgi:hypothetical protein
MKDFRSLSDEEMVKKYALVATGVIVVDEEPQTPQAKQNSQEQGVIGWQVHAGTSVHL